MARATVGVEGRPRSHGRASLLVPSGRHGVLVVRHAAGVVASGFGLVVRFSLRPGSEAAFDRLVSETVPVIGEREPGTLMYVVHEVEDAPASRVFYELYRDRAAFEEHESQGHVRRFLAEREQYLSQPPRVEFLSLRLAAGSAGT